MNVKTYKLFFLTIILPFIGFGQTDTAKKQHNNTGLIKKISIVAGIGVPNIQLYKDNPGGITSQLYSLKAFVTIKPTVDIGLCTQSMQWDYQKGSLNTSKQVAQLFFAEVNRVYSFKKINVTGGIFAGIGIVKDSYGDVTRSYSNNTSIFVAGFNMEVEYKIIKHLGLRVEIGGMTGMENYVDGTIIWPTMFGLVAYL